MMESRTGAGVEGRCRKKMIHGDSRWGKIMGNRSDLRWKRELTEEADVCGM